MNGPTLTRHNDGSITAEWPDPPRPSYEVAHEVLVEYVDQLNELNEYRRILPLLIDPGPCRFDHDGNCQEHGFTLDPGEICPNAQAIRLIRGNR